MLNNTVTIRKHLHTTTSLCIKLCGALFFIFLICNTAIAKDSCNLKSITNSVSIPLSQGIAADIKLEKGINQFELVCTLNQSGVFTFTRPALERFSWQQNNQLKAPLKTNQMAILMEQGSFNAKLTLTTTASYNPRFTWLDSQQFIEKVQLYNLIFGVFYGLCATLIFYALIIGYGIKDAIFKLYGLYLFVSLALFFYKKVNPIYLPMATFLHISATFIH